MRHSAPIVTLIALLAAGLAITPALAQGPGSVRFVVRDGSAAPQPGVTVTLDAGDGRGPAAYSTDETGATPRVISPTGLVTVTRVLDRDQAPLSFEMTSLDGLLVIPLSGDLDVPWAYDRASRSVVSLPRTMTNEAFPELEALPAEADGQGAPAAESATALLIAGEAAEAAPGNRGFWLLVAGLVLAGAGLGLFIWAKARSARRGGR
jgi:hypothetical protein